jgi:hypothetical protein
MRTPALQCLCTNMTDGILVAMDELGRRRYRRIAGNDKLNTARSDICRWGA